jgi:hypothetical protein
MDRFYLIVLSIAGILLILILTVVGIIMRRLNRSMPFPQSASTCPDYWTYSNGVCKPPSSSGPNYVAVLDSTPGYNQASGGFDPTSPEWSTKMGTTAQCGKKKWANQNSISWDGYSNFTGCK